MRLLLAIVLVATAVSAVTERERRRLALENPDLFEGDILGIDPDDRNVIPYTQMRWPGAKVPYVIDSSLVSQRSLILSAMTHYHANTCVRFVPRTTEKNYIKLFKGQGCYSYIGMINRGEQELSLGNGCHYKGTIVHELGHALGFFHEHSRSDRDEYLIIYWENIKKGAETQFIKRKPSQNLLLEPFDYDSVMLYDSYVYSKDRVSKTMVTKNGETILDNEVLSKTDIRKIKMMYGC